MRPPAPQWPSPAGRAEADPADLDDHVARLASAGRRDLAESFRRRRARLLEDPADVPGRRGK